MASNLSISAAMQLRGIYSNPLDLSTPVEAIQYNSQNDFTDGTGANQANRIWHDQRSAGSHTLDLTTGLTDAFGRNLVFTKIRGIWIRNPATSSSTITIGGSFWSQADLPTPGGWALQRGAMLAMTNPVEGWIADSTNKTITLTIAASTTADIFILGYT